VEAVAARTGVPVRAIRDWFEERLITPQRTRALVLEDESSRGLPREAVRQLADTYLVRAEHRRGAVWYELAHDRLVAPILTDNEEYRRRHGAR
jgi:hypothetical protein